jgi:hypothetical protein
VYDHLDIRKPFSLGTRRLRAVPGLRNRSIFLGAVLVLVCIVGLVPGVGNAADRNGCSNTIENPHYSSGALGIIAKGHWSCTSAPTVIYLSGERGFFLWLCPSNPPKDELWISSHCTQKGRNGTDFTISQANTDYVRYVPPSSLPGAHGTGYWIACSMWQSGGYQGTSDVHTVFSNAVYLSG